MRKTLQRGSIKRFRTISIFVLGVIALFASLASGAEDDVLKALESVKAGIEDGVKYARLGELLDEAKAATNTLQRGVSNECFRVAALRCYYWYDLGRKSWGAMIENEKHRDEYERRLESEYHDDRMKEVSPTIIENYGQLIRRAEESLPVKWEYGHAALARAHECLSDGR